MAKKKEVEVKQTNLSPEERMKILSSMKTVLKKKFGDSVIADHQKLKIESVSTGSPLLDGAITGFGYARGRFIELSGENSSGKTTTATLMLIESQRAYPDELIGFIDIEHAINLEYAQILGLDISPERFILSQPSSAEEAFEILGAFSESGLFSAICFDSIGALVTQDQLDKGMDENTIGSVGRLIGKSISRINIAACASNTTIIWINQIRTKISLFGSSETVAGGRALPFFHSTRIKIKKINVIMVKDKPVGQVVKYEVTKNKVGTPFGVIETAIYFGIGFDEYTETIEIAYKTGIIQPAGAWCYLDKGTPQELKWNGKAACIQWFRDNLEAFTPFKVRVLEANTPEVDIALATEVDEATGLTNTEVQGLEVNE